MIRQPRGGQRVRLHYAKTKWGICPLHGLAGTVAVVSRGPGPRNVGVSLDDGTWTIVPRGNLVPEGGSR